MTMQLPNEEEAPAADDQPIDPYPEDEAGEDASAQPTPKPAVPPPAKSRKVYWIVAGIAAAGLAAFVLTRPRRAA
jgi:hypothetical protein